MDEDHEIAPCPIRVFDVVSGDLVLQLDGHVEEVTGIKIVSHMTEDYLVSTSQEGQPSFFLLFLRFLWPEVNDRLHSEVETAGQLLDVGRGHCVLHAHHH